MNLSSFKTNSSYLCSLEYNIMGL